MQRRRIFSTPRLSQFTHSIRFRLVLWFVLILALVMGVFSGFIYWRQAQDARSVAIARLNYNLEHLVGTGSDEEHYLEHLVTGMQASAGLSNPQDFDVVALQSADGSILQNNGPLTNQQIQSLKLPLPGWIGVQQAHVPKIAQVENNRYLFIDPAIQQNGQLAGYLLLGAPLDANNQLGRLLVSLILGNLLTLVIALSGGFWLADRAMRPVHTITQAARQISETDLQQRLNLHGQDELSELGNTFDAMLSRLQVAFERQRQFTADASHELRTPLTIIEVEASRALTARRSVEEYENILRTIKSENHFMTRLVNNLLSLARMDAGQVKMRLEPLDLSELTSEVIERLEPLAKAQGVSLAVGDLPQAAIQGDRSALTQMLTNLVENAIKYSCGIAQPLVRISTGSLDEAGKIIAWVKVSDNGIGIAPGDQAHVFDRFYQVEASRARLEKAFSNVDGLDSTGTGLGLAIAQWIIQAHHGEIRLESTLGEGSTFEVRLPAIPAG